MTVKIEHGFVSSVWTTEIQNHPHTNYHITDPKATPLANFTSVRGYRSLYNSIAEYYQSGEGAEDYLITLGYRLAPAYADSGVGIKM